MKNAPTWGSSPGSGCSGSKSGNGNGASAASCRDARGADLIGMGDDARVGGRTGENRDAQDRPSSRRDRRGDQRLAVADVAHHSVPRAPRYAPLSPVSFQECTAALSREAPATSSRPSAV